MQHPLIKLCSTTVLTCSLSLLFLNISAAQVPGSVEARLAIRDQLTQYSYRWDAKDAAGFAALFTDDGVMESYRAGTLQPGSQLSSNEAIYDYAHTSHHGRLADRQTRHHFSGLVFLELTATTALTENMALISHQTATDSASVILSSGIYRITWTKTADVWKMSKRALFIDSFTSQ